VPILNRIMKKYSALCSIVLVSFAARAFANDNLLTFEIGQDTPLPSWLKDFECNSMMGPSCVWRKGLIRQTSPGYPPLRGIWH
jgi:hypothetical protein